MKKGIFLCIVLLGSTICFCQYRERLKENTFDPLKFKDFFVELKFNKKDKIPELKYSIVQFMDARADISKFGFAVAGQNNEYHRLLFPKPVGEYLNGKINSLLENSNTVIKHGTLLFVLNDLWVSQIIIPASFGKSLLTGPKDYLCFCYYSSECYWVNDNKLTHIGTIDTVVSLKKWIVAGADDLLKKTIITVMTIADSLLSHTEKRAQEITYEELNTQLQSEYDFPIIKTPLQKGVYLSYNDFLMNKPVLDEFIVVKDSKKEYIESRSFPDSVINNAWGYSDGKYAYFHINEKYFRMVRSQNTFELAGPRNITKFYGTGDKILNTTISTFFGGIASGGISLLLMGSENQFLKELVPYQLNIKKGTIY